MVINELTNAMNEIEPADQGALISLPTLRALFEMMSKECFDEMILEEAARGYLVLHRHVFPGALTPEEIVTLVTDGENYYIGIARRMK